MSDAVVRALFTAHISETVQIHEGELWAANDQIVAAHPEWFSSDLSTHARRTGPPAAETASDAPAEPGQELDPDMSPDESDLSEPGTPKAGAKRRYRTADEKVDV